MEDVNVSSNPSPHDAHFGIEPHPMFGNNKKLSMEQSDATSDSGYMTNWSISHNHTATNSFTSSRVGSPRSSLPTSASSSFKQLETIAENTDTKLAAVETPTTRNIRQLNDFHINTPQNNRSQFETTPKKPNYFHNASGGSLSARKKNRCQNRFSWGPYESPNSKRYSAKKIKSSGERSTLFDRNDENSYDENVCDQSIHFSPIKSHNNSNVVQVSNSPRGIIQRHPSGIGTSTPKLTFRRTHTHSTLQPNNNGQSDRKVRKIKSFNPIHRDSSVLKDSNVQNRQESIDLINDIDESPAYNPAKKMLAFSSQQFEQLIQSSHVPSIPKTPVKADDVSNKMAIRSVATASTFSPRKLANYRSQSRLNQEFSKKRPTRPASSWPKKTVEQSNESDIRMSSISYDFTATTTNLTDDIMDECFPFTEEIKQLQNASTLNANTKETIDTPTRNDSISHSIREEANRTPTKRFERCTSYHSITTKSSPEKEKNKILYHDLPCTPPKNYTRRPLKRQASALADITQPKVEPPAKRKLYGYRNTNYDGMKHLDILKHLTTDFRMAQVTEQILGHLSGKDLHAAHCVSKGWSTVIDSCEKSRIKRVQYVEESESFKENIFETTTGTANLSTNNNNDIFRRKPFQLYNDKEEVSFEAPLSPKSRRFRERLEMAKTLEPDQRLMSCRYCPGVCIVFLATMKSKTPEKTKTRRKSMRSQTHQVFTVPIRKRDYAVCQRCSLSFCLNCGHPPHDDTACIVDSDDLSENDEPKPIRSKKGKSRSNLKRLAL